MAQALHRLGASVALVEGGERVLAARAARRRRGARRGAARTTASRCTSASTRPRAPRTATRLRARVRRRHASCAATACSSPPAAARASTGIGLETVGIEPDRRGIEVDERMTAGDGLWAIGDVHRHLAADLRRQVPGRVSRRRTSSAARASADYRAVPRVVFTDPQAAAVGEADGPLTATVPLARRRADLDLHARVRRAATASSRSCPTARSSPAPTPSARRPASGCSRRRSRSARASRSRSCTTRSSRSRRSPRAFFYALQELGRAEAAA